MIQDHTQTKNQASTAQKEDPVAEEGRLVCLEYIDKPKRLSRLLPSKRSPGETAHGFVVGVTGVPDEVSDSEVATQYNKLAVWVVPSYIPWSDISGLPEGRIVRYRKEE